MKQINDYKCTNRSCEMQGQVIELYCESREDQLCEYCKEPMKKLVGGAHSKHVSWSTWRI